LFIKNYKVPNFIDSPHCYLAEKKIMEELKDKGYIVKPEMDYYSDGYSTPGSRIVIENKQRDVST
jgi:hypothetical protein